MTSQDGMVGPVPEGPDGAEAENEPVQFVKNVNNQANKDMAKMEREREEMRRRSKSLRPIEIFMIALVLSGLVGVIATALYLNYTSNLPEKRLFWPEELALYNGENDYPMYLSLMGEVYDVSSGKRYYGKGTGYHAFVGRDASRAYITGDFVNDLTDSIKGFSAEQCASLVHWRDFYRNHDKYVKVGRTIGNFYNRHGEPRRNVRVVEELARQAKSQEEIQREIESRYPGCNMRWSEARGGAVWCDDGMYPRKVFTQLPSGKPTTRCACFKELGWSDVRQVYPSCSPDAHECQTSPPGPAARQGDGKDEL